MITFRQKLFLLFNKKKAVCAIIFHEDRRMQISFKVPDQSNHITIDDTPRMITKDGYNMLNNMPLYIYNNNNPQPIDIRNMKDPGMSAQDYKIALKAKVIQEMFDAYQDGMKIDTLVKIGIFVTVAAVAGAGYYMVSQLEPIIMKLDEIIEMLQVIGGGN